MGGVPRFFANCIVLTLVILVVQRRYYISKKDSVIFRAQINQIREMECIKNFNTWDCKNAANGNCAPAPPRPIKASFWTQCSARQIKFEYLICYLKKQLHCCSASRFKPYIAVEIPPLPINDDSSSNS